MSFRGDNVNGMDLKDRQPDPDRLLQAYFHSAATLNYVRSILSSGFADLHHPEAWTLDWNLRHVRSDQRRFDYQEVVDKLNESLEFMRVIGADSEGGNMATRTVDMFVSHEVSFSRF